MAFVDDLKAEKQLLEEKLKRVDDELAAVGRQSEALQKQRSAITKAIKGIGEAERATADLDSLDPPGPTKTNTPPAARPVNVPMAIPAKKED